MTRADRTRRALVAALATVLLAGCTSGGGSEASPPASTPTTSASTGGAPAPPTAYAALGDSYSAAPFVPTTDVAGGCFRSSGNYPSLVEAALDPGAFTDVTCSGADSRDLVKPQQVAGGQGRVPTQLRAVRRDTDLVTVGIGGNDGDLFSELVCGFTQQQIPQCEGSPRVADLAGTLATTRKDVTRSLRRVVDRAAPDALVLLVGYPRLVDPARSCAALPIERTRSAYVARAELRLRATLRSAARAAGVEFLDLFPVSRGHEICSDDPWVNGAVTDQSRALAYHPFAAEQEAVARLVERRWEEHAG